MNSVILAFFTGLTSGGVSCFAVQGGLLASCLASQKRENQKSAVLLFVIARLTAYALLGAALGVLGEKVAISPKFQGLMQIFAGIFILLTVAKLIEIHPIFRKVSFTPPKALFRILRRKSLSEEAYAPAVLGFLTVLIPCGVTQAMMLLSIASGSIFLGSLILASFILGTTPLFLALGFFSGQIFKYASLKYIAALTITILGIISINTGQILRGSPHTLQNYWLAATGRLESQIVTAQVAGINSEGKQEVEIKVFSNGYESNTKALKVGVPVRINLVSENAKGCARSFTIPQLNISKVIPENGTTVVEFTPTQKGRLTYTCSMGMFSGYFDVI